MVVICFLGDKKSVCVHLWRLLVVRCLNAILPLGLKEGTKTWVWAASILPIAFCSCCVRVRVLLLLADALQSGALHKPLLEVT